MMAKAARHGTVDILVDKARGYRQRIRGEIGWQGPVGDQNLTILKNLTIYAYHPSNPNNGRYLPGGREMAFDTAEVKEEEG